MLQQNSATIIFDCPCGFKGDLEKEDYVQQHITYCQFFQSASYVQNQISLLPINKMSLKDLLVMKLDLKIIMNQINGALFELGYDKAYDEPLKLRKGGSNAKQHSFEEWVIDHQGKCNTPIKCPCCNKVFDMVHQSEQLWCLDRCAHFICRPCLSKLINSEFIQNDGQVKCVTCKDSIERYEIAEVMGKDKINELEKQLLRKMYNIVECVKCNNEFSYEQGDPNSIVKDAKGNKLDGVLLQHYVENRFTCPSCKSEQCKSCNSIPYHLGYDCDGFKHVMKSKKCRFCDSTINQVDQSKPLALQEVCDQADCQKRSQQVCLKVHKCGHPCCGYQNEINCLPCMEPDCIKPQDNFQQNADDYCNICFTEALKSAPCVRSKCGHVFHQECITKRLETKWNGPRIIFNFCLCPLCKVWLEFPGDNQMLTSHMKQNRQLFEGIKVKVLERLKIEQRDKDKELTDTQNPYYQKPLEYGMAIFAYYQCYKCNGPYFGGLKSCQLNIEDERRQFDKSELVCPKCCPVSFESDCKKHGKDYIEFKCKFCCSIALWFCWGTTHFCEPCHRKATEMSKKSPKDLPQCKNPESCPLRIAHKQNGEECALGCGLCRQERILEESKKLQKKQ